MTVTVDNNGCVKLPGAKPGDVFEVQDAGAQKVFTLRKSCKTQYSRGKLVRDVRTGLLVWLGDFGEDPSDAVIRNRLND